MTTENQELPSKSEEFHERLRRHRIARGLTAKAMARLVGVPSSTYREWENGRGMKLPPLQKISQVLAISVTELTFGEKPQWLNYLEELEQVERKIHELRLNIGSLV